MKPRFRRRGDAYRSTARAILDAHGAHPGPIGDDPIAGTLGRLRPEDLEPVWRYVDSLEQRGLVRDAEAARWKDAIVDVMETLGIETRGLPGAWENRDLPREPRAIRGPLPN